MSEVETRRLPAASTASAFGDLLGRHMWVSAVDAGFTAARPYLIIQGSLKPDPAAPDPAAVRRSFLDSLDAIMAILDAAGARHHHHPELIMHGQAREMDDGSQGFEGIRCLVKITLYR